MTPDELPALLELYPDVRGLMTMPPATADPEESRPYFRRLRELAELHGLPELSMGTSQDFRIAAEEGATLRPDRERPVAAVTSSPDGSRKRLGARTRLLRHRR